MHVVREEIKIDNCYFVYFPHKQKYMNYYKVNMLLSVFKSTLSFSNHKS